MPVPIPPPGSSSFWNDGISAIPGMEALEAQEDTEEQNALVQGIAPENQETILQAQADAESMLDESWRGKATRLLRDAGAPMNDRLVRDMIRAIDNQGPEFDRQPGLFDGVLSANIDALISAGKISQTPHTQALQASGFGFETPEFTEINPALLGSGDSAFLQNLTEAEKGFVVHPETGWKQYKNGALVDPNQPFGSFSAVTFDQGSQAPGSQQWATQQVAKWSLDKINEWRGRLIEGGYLASGSKKGPADTEFLNAMVQYQIVKYQNDGTPMALGPVIEAGGGTTPYNFNQIRASIDEDVRGAWEAIYGTRPDESEVEAQRDMVIKVARKLYDKGQLSPEGAAAEAEARILGRMERTPEARFVTENVEENTELRDQMLRAVQVTSMMS